MPSPGFGSLVFYIDPLTTCPAPLVAVAATDPKGRERQRMCQSGTVIHGPGERGDEVSPTEWHTLNHLAGVAACCRLLLANRSSLALLDEALFHLQRHCSLPPISKGTKAANVEQLLASPLREAAPLLPFKQRRLGNPSAMTTCMALDCCDEGTLTAEHFRFVRAQRAPDGSWILSQDDDAELPSGDLEELLQAGFAMPQQSMIRADWNSFRSWPKFPKCPDYMVELKELGPILRQYREIIGLADETILDNYEKWTPPAGQGSQWELTGSQGDRKTRLADLFVGGISQRVPYVKLKRLLSSFAMPGASEDTMDVAELMAEWLTAERQSTCCLKIDLKDFRAPPVMEHGVGTIYRNAPFRLDGFECAFVRVAFAPNEAVIDVDGAPKKIDKISDLMRHFDHPAARAVPHSKLHVHPGDEFILILKGSVFARLENTGIWSLLLTGDICHFNAEIPHALWNLGNEEAVAFVVRFFQLERHGTRQNQIQSLQRIASLMASLGREKTVPPSHGPRVRLLDFLKTHFPAWIKESQESYVLWTQIASWVQDRTRPPQDRLRKIGPDAPMQDLVGLSRYLHTHLMQEYPDKPDLPPRLQALKTTLIELHQKLHELQMTLSPKRDKLRDTRRDKLLDESFGVLMDLDEDLNELATDPTYTEAEKAQLRPCFDGVAPSADSVPGVGVVKKLAGQLGIPSVLLEGFVAPPALRVVFVRGADAEWPDRCRDWVQPRYDAAGEGARGVDYCIPSRTLASSDMTLTLLTLEAQGNTDWNHHPGFEVIIPLSGKVKVEFKNDKLPGSDACGPDEMLVYRSANSHRLCLVSPAPGRKRGTALVMRFTILDPRLPSS